MIDNVQFSHYEVIQDRGRAIKKGISMLTDRDIILILGKGHEEFIIVGNKKIPFNDRKEVKDALNELSETYIKYDDGFDPKELCIDFPCLKKFFSNYKQRKNVKKVLRKKDYSNE